MYTIIETPSFVDDAKRLWSEEERGAFCAWLAANPEVGTVIPGSGGCRKVRWTRSGSGKQGGERVIYFTRGNLASCYLQQSGKREHTRTHFEVCTGGSRE